MSGLALGEPQQNALFFADQAGCNAPDSDCAIAVLSHDDDCRIGDGDEEGLLLGGVSRTQPGRAGPEQHDTRHARKVSAIDHTLQGERQLVLSFA
jgi:hypothetical protein